MLPTRKFMPRSSRQLDHKPPDYFKETQSAVVWSCLPFIRSGQNHLARHSEMGKKTRQAEEELGRQHQGMDRPGVRQVPEGSGEKGKWRKLVAESSVVSQRPSRLWVRWDDERARTDQCLRSDDNVIGNSLKLLECRTASKPKTTRKSFEQFWVGSTLLDFVSYHFEFQARRTSNLQE